MNGRGFGDVLRKLACAAGTPHAGRTIHRSDLLIVMYHGVTRDPLVARRWWHHVLVSDFERQLHYLAAHYDVRPLDEALASLWSGGLARPTACITFDDGYRNNHAVAFPVLQRLGIPATIYLTTGMIGTQRRLWTVELDHAFTETKAEQVDLTVLGLGVAQLDGQDRRVLFSRVLNGVKEVPQRDRAAVLDTIMHQLKTTDRGSTHEPFTMMDWAEARMMAESGLVTFGGHTVNHEIVSRLRDKDVYVEIVESIESVKENVSAVSNTFAYPNGGRGDFDTRAIDAVRSTGCDGAVTTIEGLCDRNTDHFGLHRIGIGSDTTFDQFRLLTSGLITDIKRVITIGA